MEMKRLVREIRRSQGDLNQTDFAALVGVTQRAVSFWETGRRTPNRQASIGALLRIARPDHRRRFLELLGIEDVDLFAADLLASAQVTLVQFDVTQSPSFGDVRLVMREHGIISIEYHPSGRRIVGVYCKQCGYSQLPTLLLGAVLCAQCDTVIAKRGDVICAICNALLPEDGEAVLCVSCQEQEAGERQSVADEMYLRRYG